MKRLVYSVDTKNFDSPEHDGIMAKAFSRFDEHAKEEDEQQSDQVKARLTPEGNDVRNQFSPLPFLLFYLLSS